MKRIRWMGVMLALAVLLPAVGCKKKGDKVLNALPAGAKVVFWLDFSRLAQQDFFDQLINQKPAAAAEEKSGSMSFKDYRDFVDKTGIDPKKDILSVAGAVYGELGESNPDLLFVVQARYDRGKLLALLRRETPGMKEETRGAALVCSAPESSGRPMQFALLGSDLLLVGSSARVNAAIDLSTGKGGSLLGEGAVKKQLGRVNRTSMFWLVLASLPEGMKKGPPAGSPIQLDMSKAEALLLALDYKDRALSGDLQLIQPDEKANAQIAASLNGFKGMGAMFAAKEPGASEVINSLQITSTADTVRLVFSLPESLLKKLAAKAKEKALAPAAPEEPDLSAAEPDSAPGDEAAAAEPATEEPSAGEPEKGPDLP